MNNDNNNWDIVLIYSGILAGAALILYIVVNLIIDTI